MLPLFTGITVPRLWPQEGNIVFEDVSLRYDTSRDPIISNLNLHIPAGQKVNIVSVHCRIFLTSFLWTQKSINVKRHVTLASEA
jgi:hypothetical protein